ncbi:AraC-like DNA-binding protein [Pedobacter cryoconitis]|uniref:AraC-like DNA-binding protein n=1 Tax=Pedobacter cryoconitis TaxID=188932 RepID=A0A7W9DXQ0_9SPHI|nr:AraC family transcriptional regulator [Pedobacter cryoconitis]MBB5635168.1 AraC-like DNA-binding protein [Pedobacter cryoconitis]MBB6271648.1 AraC-like DNA-binding protein [Pedobacter cryoconitis]
MNNSTISKRRDGFDGQKIIHIPPRILKDYLKKHPALFHIYIAHIGYFPKAFSHYREWRKGCDDNIFIYCLTGKGYYIIDDQKFEVTPNQFFVIPATDKFIKYWADTDDPWTIYWVHYTGSIIDNFNTSLNIDFSKGPVPIAFNNKAIEIWKNIYQCLEMGYSIENLCNANFRLYHFIASFLFPDKNARSENNVNLDIINSTIMDMKNNIDKKLVVEDMANLHKLSCSHFSSLFRKATGMPPIDYFIHLKMQKACQLLYTNKAKIKEVAMDLGYEDPYYFSRLFKKYMGLSPEQYKLTTSGQLSLQSEL